MGTLVSASAASMGRTTGGAQSQQGGEDSLWFKNIARLSFQMVKITFNAMTNDHHQKALCSEISSTGKAIEHTKISHRVEFEFLVGFWERGAVGSYYGTCYQTKLS